MMFITRDSIATISEYQLRETTASYAHLEVFADDGEGEGEVDEDPASPIKVGGTNCRKSSGPYFALLFSIHDFVSFCTNKSIQF
jgi:hypothetical protein